MSVESHELIKQKQGKAGKAEAAGKVTAPACQGARKFSAMANKDLIFQCYSLKPLCMSCST